MTNSEQPALDGTLPAAAANKAGRRVDDYETWIDEVWPAFESAADSGLPFTTSEIAKTHDLPDPPNPQAQWGKLPSRLIKAGLIEVFATGNSKRATVHGSLVHTWIGIPAHRRRAAA